MATARKCHVRIAFGEVEQKLRLQVSTVMIDRNAVFEVLIALNNNVVCCRY